jgi:hypothetical protein
VQLVAQVRARHRPDAVESATDERTSTNGHELVGHRLGTMNRLAADADWPPLPKRDFTAASAAAQVGVVEHHERVGAAQLEHALLEAARRPSRRLARALDAGERHGRDAGSRRSAASSRPSCASASTTVREQPGRAPASANSRRWPARSRSRSASASARRRCP